MSGARTVVLALSPDRARALRADLDAARGFARHPHPSAAWAFRGDAVVVAFYGSGKLVVQGAGAESFASSFLGGAPAPRLEALDDDLVGTDESGKGDYFGPLVVAAVFVGKGQERVLEELGVRDCKEVSDGAAKETAAALRAGWPHEVVAISPARYNELYAEFGNLNRLLGWATAQAIEGVLRAHPCRKVLSDKFGNERYIADALRKKGIEVDLSQRIRAEVNPAVAAASILARDRFLMELARLSREAGVTLPKGASPAVEAAARGLFRAGGIEALRGVAKLHFRTTERVTDRLF